MARNVSYTNTGSQTLLVSEEHCHYVSSRLGMDQRRDALFLGGAYNPTWCGTSSARRELGNKHYELSNHLGNVLLSVTDKKAYKTLSGSLYFEAEISTISDYYPFGSAIETRAYSAVGYRFGFNTQERETELGADLTSAEFWMYDGKLGRRWNVDPVMKAYESPYGCLGNNPNITTDFNGSDTITVVKNSSSDKWKITSTVLAKGNDVFRISHPNYSMKVEFQEGTYGNRINVLRLEDKPNETFGIFHHSGTSEVGFYVEPEGPDTKEENKNKRIPLGLYNLNYHIGGRWPGYPLIFNETVPKHRGVKIHWGTGRSWSQACLVVSNAYEVSSEGRIVFNKEESESTSVLVNKYLGSIGYNPNVLNDRNNRRGKNLYSDLHRINSAKVSIKEGWLTGF